VKYSQDLNRIILPCKKRCKSCGLYLNQLPIFDTKEQSQIFWVGLSAVQIADDNEKRPLSADTASGSLVAAIEEPFINELHFYKTNLVKCLPLRDNKIRYPIEEEMEKCFPNFENELEIYKPSIVFLLGKQVATFISKKYSVGKMNLNGQFNYDSFSYNGVTYVPIHHPSYILVYKRKHVKKYIRKIQSRFLENIAESNIKFPNKNSKKRAA